MTDVAKRRAQTMLQRWAEAVEPYWNDLTPTLGCYGPGYIHWGVQSNFNYAAAMATLAVQPDVDRAEHWRGRALAALRFALVTHVSGTRKGLNGEQWGHSWISMLGIERAMHGVARLEVYLTPQDRADLRRVLTSEASWLLHHGQRSGHRDVNAALWNSTGRNVPESNIWAGALLWRSAHLFPDEPEAASWRERAHEYLINGVSIPADAGDPMVVADKSVRERHVGANFFPHYALDHHGYLNVGYMAICTSNAAMLHFDMKAAGLARPDSLDHHQGDLWQVLRRLIFPDGRLARIGGDSRVRYSYCQEYLLPSLLYAADRFRDPHVLGLAARQIEWMAREHQASNDGTFYGRRMGHMRDANPHYFTRLESDRACVLAVYLNYLPLVTRPDAPSQSFEAAVAGGWVEPEHGAVLQRSAQRLASFSWRAHGLTQALCQPPDASDLAEWSANLCPVLRFLGDDGQRPGQHRRLLHQRTDSFDGGFVVCGAVVEGVDIRVDEGAHCSDQAVSHVAFAALPDGRTCLGLQYAVAAPDRVGYTTEVKGLHLNLPNDLFNDFRRCLTTAQGERVLTSPPARDAVLDLDSRWLNVDGKMGVVALYGGEFLRIDRSTQRRGGRYRSLFVEEICLGVETDLRRRSPNEVLIDLGFAVLSGVDAETTAALEGGPLDLGADDVRGSWVRGADDKHYVLVANFGKAAVSVKVFGQRVDLAAGQAKLVASESRRS